LTIPSNSRSTCQLPSKPRCSIVSGAGNSSRTSPITRAGKSKFGGDTSQHWTTCDRGGASYWRLCNLSAISQYHACAITDAEPNDASRNAVWRRVHRLLAKCSKAGNAPRWAAILHSALDIVKRLWEPNPDNPRLEAGFVPFLPEDSRSVGDPRQSAQHWKTYQLSREAAAGCLTSRQQRDLRQMIAPIVCGHGSGPQGTTEVADALKFYREENAVIRISPKSTPDIIDCSTIWPPPT